MNDTEIFEVCEQLGLEINHCWKKDFSIYFEGQYLEISRIRLNSKLDLIHRIFRAFRASGYKSGRNDLKVDLKNLLSVESDQ